jgi:hypothetical protein
MGQIAFCRDETLFYGINPYLPANGQSLLTLAKADAGGHIGKFLKIDQANASAGICKEHTCNFTSF